MSVFSQDIAEESWHKYLLRNQSVIVRVFQGQLKSTLICPDCNLVRRAITHHAWGKEGNQDSMYTSNAHMHSHLHTLSHIKLIHNHTLTHMYFLSQSRSHLCHHNASRTLTITLTPHHNTPITHVTHSDRFPKSLIPSCSCHYHFPSRRHVPSL